MAGGHPPRCGKLSPMNMLAVQDRAKQLSLGLSGQNFSRPGQMQGFPAGGRMQRGGVRAGRPPVGVRAGNASRAPGRVPRAARPSAVIAGARAQVGSTHPGSRGGRPSSNGLDDGGDMMGGMGGLMRTSQVAPAALSARGSRGSTRLGGRGGSAGRQVGPRAGPGRGGPVAEAGGQPQIVPGEFYPARRFEGKREGFAFKRGSRGVGYYRDRVGGPVPLMAEADVTAVFEEDGPLGISFPEDRTPLIISAVNPNSVAGKQPGLRPGLVLRSVNGQEVGSLSYEQTVRLMLNTVERPLALGFSLALPGGDRPSSRTKSRPSSRASTPGSGVAETMEEGADAMEAMGQMLGLQVGADWNAKPETLQRAKSWEPQVEVAFRFQTAGWRDAREYLASGVGKMDLWPPETRASIAWPKKLRMKGSASDFCYFRRNRECSDSMCNRIKIFTYAT